MKKKKITICLFGTYYYSYSRNAVLRSGLKANGVRVLEAHVPARKNRLESSSDISIYNIFRILIDKLHILTQLLREYEKVKKADAVVVLYPGYIILPVAWILAKIFRKKLLFDSFTSVYDSLINDRELAPKKSIIARGVKLFETILLTLPDQIFVDTPLMGEYIREEFHVPDSKMFVIPVGSDTSIYKPTSSKTRKHLKAIWFGGYSPLQAAEFIVKAAKILSAYSNIHFTLVGDGLLKKNVVEYAKKHLLSNVTFISEITDKELAEKIGDSDIMLGIFANNSMARRVIPNKVFAGISSKKAVVTGALPPVKDVFTDNHNIVFVKPKNPEDLAEKLYSLEKNKKLMRAVAENGYALFKKKFTPKIIAAQFLREISL